MSCQWTQARLSTRFGELLTTAERKHVEAHLTNCAACRRVDEQLRLAVGELRATPEARVSSQFMAHLRAALPARRLPRWRVWFRESFGFGVSYAARRAALAGATALVLLSGTTGAVHRRQAEKRATEYLALCAARHELYAVREAEDKSMLW